MAPARKLFNIMFDPSLLPNTLQHALRPQLNAIHLNPEDADAWSALAVSLAEYSYQHTFAASETVRTLEAAIQSYHMLVNLQPDNANAWNELGCLHLYRNQLTPAEDAFRHALRVNSRLACAHGNLGLIFSRQNRISEAIAASEQALALEPDSMAALNLAQLYGLRGDADQAVTSARRALHNSPGQTQVYGPLLMSMIYAGSSTTERQHILGCYRQHVEDTQRWPTAHLNNPDPERKLRIAYLSGDFCRHASSYFTESLRLHQDHTQFEIYCYYNGDTHDALTQRYMNYFADHWRHTYGASADAVAAQMRTDGIDIAIDLAGHTKNNLLEALARKPAPVQLTWLGYPDSTGLSSIDWRITDYIADPDTPQRQNLYTEQLLRLSGPFCAYTPLVDAPEKCHDPAYQPSQTPCLTQGHITFGSASNIVRLTDATLQLWSKVVLATPGATLLLESTGLEEPAIAERLYQRFACAGLPAERLHLIPRKESPQYQIYHRIDIALDPWPCNAGTTTLDALWMGVPVVSLAGEAFFSRIGASMLTHLGHPEWIAHDEEAFVHIAHSLASDPLHLNAQRTALRAEMERSPLMDTMGFTRQFEKALRQGWQAWCSSPAASTARQNAQEKQEALSLCQVLLEQQAYTDALSAYQMVRARWQESGEAWYGIGLCLLLGEQCVEQAYHALEQAAPLLRREDKQDALADCLSALGNISLLLGNTQAATDQFQQSLQHKESPDVRAWLASMASP